MNTHTPRVDVAVVGGGPGGSAAALAAAQSGLSVVLFEPQRGPMDKPCGEGLMAEGVHALDTLGIDTARAHGIFFGTISFHFADHEPLRVPLSRPGLALPRPELLGHLRSAMERVASIQLVRSAATVERQDEGFVLRTPGGRLEHARWLIVADGLGGRCAPWLRGRRRVNSRGRLGLRARFEIRPALEEVEVHLSPRCELYLTPLPGGVVNLVALFEAQSGGQGRAELLAGALGEHPRLRARLGRCTTTPELRLLAHSMPRRASDGDSFLIGDAGGGVDPIVGCGLSLALGSGLAAARGALRRQGGERAGIVAADYAREYAEATRARRRLAACLRLAARQPRLGRGLAGILRRMPRVLRSLATIAAGDSHDQLSGRVARP
jgi:flavin-dependent dehydrogenase